MKEITEAKYKAKIRDLCTPCLGWGGWGDMQYKPVTFVVVHDQFENACKLLAESAVVARDHVVTMMNDIATQEKAKEGSKLIDKILAEQSLKFIREDKALYKDKHPERKGWGGRHSKKCKRYF